MSFLVFLPYCIDTVNPRISPLGAYLFLYLLRGGLFEGRLFKVFMTDAISRGGLIRGGANKTVMIHAT